MHNKKPEIAIQRLLSLVEQLAMQSAQVDQLNANHKSHHLIENNNLFSRQLFSTESDLFTPYVNEVNKRLNNFSRLQKLSNENLNKMEFAKTSLQQIEQQILAITNAIQANQAMHKAAQVSFDARKKVRIRRAKATTSNKYDKIAKTIMLSSHQLYQQLTEHHEFERRLMAMINEREQQRQKSRGMNTAQLSQEVLALHQRLGRCRKAISAIERNIENAEKKNLR